MHLPNAIILLATDISTGGLSAAALEQRRMNTCLAGRKVLLLGDSLMRQQYVSLGCLLKSKTWMARAGIWGPALTNVLADVAESSLTNSRWWIEHLKEFLLALQQFKYHTDLVDGDRQGVQRDYTVKVNGDHKPILKQFLGDLHLHGNGSVHLRSFGQFNLSLWDDTLREFEQAYGKLTPRDIVMFNFGAWYPRLLPLNPWPTFMSSMQEFVMSRLRHLNATVIWKEYTPTHFGGHTGTFTWFHRDFRPSDPKCEPASRGEFWYDDYMRKVLEDCGERCKHIRILPVFNAALPRHNMHHGSVGRSYPQTDCRNLWKKGACHTRGPHLRNSIGYLSGTVVNCCGLFAQDPALQVVAFMCNTLNYPAG
eukprot:jgi/Botrbrau1/17013/Bobra.49_2s0071.1